MLRPLPEIVREFRRRLPRAGIAAVVVISKGHCDLVFWPNSDEKDPSRLKDPLAELERLVSGGGVPVAFLVAESVGDSWKYEAVVLKEFERERRILNFLRSYSEILQAGLRRAGFSILIPELN